MAQTKSGAVSKPLEYTYSVIIEPAEEGGYLARIPALNNSVTEGETMEEARVMAKDLIEGYIQSLLMDSLPIPIEEGSLAGEKITARVSVHAR